MASIVGKRQGGRTYYYLVESARVGGKPRIVSQRYLGPADEILARLEGKDQAEAVRSRHLAFGDLASVWSMLRRLEVGETIDEVVGGRRSDAGASVGTYLALACLNRVVAPCSKLGFADWWKTTAGDRLVKIPLSALDHRRFWEAMDQVDDTAIAEIEARLSRRIIEVFELDCSGLVLDMTNFATWIDSTNTRAAIAQRGHSKQKRFDLRLVGLGLVVTKDGAIPLLSHAYAGNRPDVTQFADMVTALAHRFAGLTDTGELTLVYDAGQDSAANQTIIEATGIHYLGSLRPSDHTELLKVPRSQYQPVDPQRFPGLSAFETRTQALGADRRAVVTFSEELFNAQRRGLAQSLAKASRSLLRLQQALAGGRSRRTRAAIEAEIAQILAHRYLKRCLDGVLHGDEPGQFRLEVIEHENGRRALEREVFGKRILFTDHQDWGIPDVVAAYRSQWLIESDFRQMKDPDVVSFSPMHHFTDQKIRVHVFYCVLALQIARLMARQAQRAGLDLSVRQLLCTLAGIQETVLLYPSTGGRPRARRLLTDMDEHQRQLYDLFNLDAWAPPT